MDASNEPTVLLPKELTNPNSHAGVKINARYSPDRPEAKTHLAECERLAKYHDFLETPITERKEVEERVERTVFPVAPGSHANRIILNGVGYPSIADAARALGIPYQRLSRAWNWGWRAISFEGREWSIERKSA